MEEKIESCPLKVGVRIRSIDSNDLLAISYDDINKLLVVGDRSFVFDQIFESHSKQEHIYNETVRPLIFKLLIGYSCTVLTYGQTGTGKTYTVFGDLNNNMDDEHSGLILRALKQIFSEIPPNDEFAERRIDISFIEIYNQKIIDMIQQNQLDKTICSLKNLKVEPNIFQEVKTFSEAQELLYFGIKKRHVSHTKLNEYSSRSHAIFTIKITTKTNNNSTIAKLNLVDLGGSERINRTGNEGLARQEGININQSLLCLRQVLMAISKNDKIVPFRDSILTTILHDSLTIKNFIILIACICPRIENFNETITTLRFAESAKNVISRPNIDVIYKSSMVQKSNSTRKLKIEKYNSVIKTPMKKKCYSTLATPYKSLKTNVFKTRKSFTTSAFQRKRTRDMFRKFKKDILIRARKNDELSMQSSYDLKLNESNFSTSTKLENMELPYSPIVRKCTQQIETKLENLVKTQLYTVISRRSKRILPIYSPKCENTAIDPKLLTEKILSTVNKNLEIFLNMKSRELDFKTFSDSDEAISNCTCSRKLFSDDSEIRKKQNSLKLSNVEEDKENYLLTSTRIVQHPQNFSPIVKQLLNKKSYRSKNVSMLSFELSQIKDYKSLTPKSKQSAFVFTLLNTGSLEDLLLLPTIGKKTATQIITYRMINGEFSSIQNMKKMPFWKGKQFERFLKANNLI